VYGTSQVGVYQSKAPGAGRGAAFFSGLATCGSVWVCPVCAAKVQERRRVEIAQAMEWAYTVPVHQPPPQGYQRERDARAQPIMVTLTFPHRAWDDLGELLDKQAEALDLLRSGAPWKRWVKASGYQGLIRALELTHGRNGWHPHTHELWMVSPEFDASAMRETIARHWASACKRAGLLDDDDAKQLSWFMQRAVDVKPWCSTSDYLAKYDDAAHWGVDREMAKASTKLGRRKGLHPFGLLAKAMDGDERAGRLFVSFASVVTERRKRQLYWSPGLKGRTGVAERTDEQLADESVEAADLLGSITLDDWRVVRAVKAQAAVLDAAEAGGWPAVETLIERLIVAECDRLEALLAGRMSNGPPGPAGVHQASLLTT